MTEHSLRKALKALDKSASGAEVAKHLRQTAVALKREGSDTSRWLQSDLVAPKALAILRSLPAGHPPKEAAKVAEAAAAVLNNLFMGLRARPHILRFRTLLAADEAACSALVLWCMGQPGSTEQLPPAQQDAWRPLDQYAPPGAAGLRQPFWTPFTNCAGFLTAVSMAVSLGSVYNAEVHLNLTSAATPSVVERVLRVSIQHPSLLPWQFLFLLSCGSCAATLEAVEAHHPLMLRAINEAARITTSVLTSSSEAEGCQHMACLNSIVANTTLLCSAKMDDLNDGCPDSAEGCLELLLALVDMVLPVLSGFQRDRHLGDLVGRAVSLTRDALGLLTRFGVVGTPTGSSKACLAALVLQKARLELWFECLGEVGSQEPIAGEVVSLLLHAVTRNVWMADYYTVKRGGMDIGAAKAAEVLTSLLLAPAEESVCACLQPRGGSGTLQVPTATLLRLLVEGCSLRSPLLIQGMLQLASRLPWSSLDEPTMQLAVQLMHRLEEAADAGRFLGCSPDAHCNGGLVGVVAGRVLTVHAHHDAMAAVADMVDLLKHLEHPPIQLAPHQVSTCRKAALLAIGDHIESGEANWPFCRPFAEGSLWSFVSNTTRHRMAGPQLQGLFLALKQQGQGGHERGAGAAATRERKESGHRGAEEQRVAACVAAVQEAAASAAAAGGLAARAAVPVACQDARQAALRTAVLRLCARTEAQLWLLQPGLGAKVGGCLFCSDPGTRRAAYQAVDHALLAAHKEPALRAPAEEGLAPGVQAVSVASVVLHRLARSPGALQPFHWDEEGLEREEAAELDVWLAAAGLRLAEQAGGLGDEELWGVLGRCTGWGELKAWCLRQVADKQAVDAQKGGDTPPAAAAAAAVRRDMRCTFASGLLGAMATSEERMRELGLWELVRDWEGEVRAGRTGQEFQEATTGDPPCTTAGVTVSPGHCSVPAAAPRSPADAPDVKAASDAGPSTSGSSKSARSRKAAAAAGKRLVCGHCGSDGASKLCGGCEKTWYCGPGCQKAHWKLHRPQCKALQELRAT